MVYKKFIRRGGKVYGPYLYHNTKKNGRVITHYLGKHQNKKEDRTFFRVRLEPSKKFWLVAGFLALFVGILFVALFFLLDLGLTGKASVEIKDSYFPGEAISGKVNLALKHGELFPADSRLIIDNAGEISEYSLRELVAEQTNIGDFYVEDKELIDSGEGFGVLGQKEVYPSVKFSFKIIEKIAGEEGGGLVEENITEEPSNESITEPPTETPIEPPVEEPSQPPSEEPSTPPTEETPAETSGEIPTETSTEATSEPSTETPSSETPSASETSSDAGSSETTSDSSSSDSGSSESSGTITGEAIGEDAENLINAEASKENPFTYELQDQDIEIVYSEHPVKLEKDGSKAIITTDYSEIEAGFGQEYLTDEIFYVPISISELGLIAKEGDLNIKFVYNDVELVSATKKIKVISNETLVNLTNITETNVTAQNLTNITKLERLNEIIATKNFKISSKVLAKLAESDQKVKVLIKKDVGVYEFMELDEAGLALLPNEALEIALDEPINLFLTDSEGIIRSLEARNTFNLDGSGEKVCIIDTGADSSVVPYALGFDFVNNDSDSSDDNGHGTKVANIAKTIAPGAELLIAKVIDASGVGYESNVLQGIQYCMDNNADVISFSIGAGSYNGYCDSNFVAELANIAVDNGIFVVAATGNDGSENMASPSCGSKVLRASATNKNDNIAVFANVNLATDVFAPGQDISTKTIGGAGEILTGTSASAPMIAGGAALILENESLSPEQLSYRLKSTGKPIEFNGINISRIDVYNAVINNMTMTPYGYELNQSNATNETLEYRLFGLYKQDPVTDVGVTRPEYPCSTSYVQIGNSFPINEIFTTLADIRMRVRTDGTPGIASCNLRICSQSGSCSNSLSASPSSSSWINTSWYSVSSTVNVSGTYYFQACNSAGFQFPFCLIDWAELNVTGPTEFFSVNLTSPQDLYIPSTNDLTFQCEVSSAYNLSSVELFGNWSGSWSSKSTGITGNVTSYLATFNINNIPLGAYAWNCKANDVKGNSNFSQSNRTFTIDPCLPPTDADWNISQACVINSKSLILAQNKNLNILNGGNLTLINSQLNMLPFSGNGSSNITVFSGGSLNLTSNSVIKVLSGLNQFGFVVKSGANLSAVNSRIEDVGWANADGARGIEVNSTLTKFSGNIINDSFYGLYLLKENNIILGNSFSQLIEGGILVYGDNNTIFMNNITRTKICMDIKRIGSSTRYNNVSGNNLFYCSNIALNLDHASDSNYNGNNMSNGGTGIQIISVIGVSFLTNFTDNFIFNNSGSGIKTDFQANFNNYTFLRNVIKNNSYGVNFDVNSNPPRNNSFIDSVIENNSVYDIFNEGDNNTYINTTFNRSRVSISNGYINVFWYLDIKVEDGAGQGLNSALVEAYNQTGSLSFSESTNSGGFIQRKTPRDFFQNSTQVISENPYTINSSWQGRKNSTQINIAQSTYLEILINLPPSVSNVILNSSLNLNTTIENLSVYYSKTDIDNDPVVAITDWRVNGSSIAVLNMPFDTNLSGVGAVLKDYSTFANHGNLGNSTSGAEPAWTSSGKVGGAYNFDGVNDIISIADDPSLNLTKSLSVEVWIKPAMAHEGGGNFGVLAKALEPLWSWQLRFGGMDKAASTDRLGFQFNNGSLPGVWVNIDQDLVNGQWYHIVGVYNGSHAMIYLNGALKDIQPLPVLLGSSAPLLIGNEGWPGNYFNGTIDEIRIYNRSLSQEQILMLYQAGNLGSSLEKISSHETNYGEVWSVNITPNDRIGDGASALSNTLAIINNPPIFIVASLTPLIAYTNSTLSCEFNITDADNPQLNVSVLWYKNGAKFIEENITGYNQGTNFTANLSHEYTYNSDSVFCNVSATDGIISPGWNSSASRTIQNYATSLAIANETGKRANESIRFNATYTSAKLGGDIKSVIWNSPNLATDVMAVSFFKCNNNSLAECFVVGLYGGNLGGKELIFYNSSFVNFSYGISYSNIYDIKPHDFNGDGKEEIVVGSASPTRGIMLFYSNGTKSWESGTGSSTVTYLAVGDVDNDGVFEIAGAQSAYPYNVFVYNYTGTKLWNHPRNIGSGYRGLAFGNFSQQGKIVFGIHNAGSGVLNSTGASIWNQSITGSAGDVNIINLDSDSNYEILIGLELQAFDDNYNPLWSLDLTDPVRYEIEVADIDNDGQQEIVVSDGTLGGGSGPGYVRAYDADYTSATPKWVYSRTSTYQPASFAMSLIAEDINDNPYKEVVFGGVDNTTFVLNHTGGLIFEAPVYGWIGGTDTTIGSGLPLGRHSSIDVGDINGDGVNEILVASSNNTLHIFQDASCRIAFNDSVFAEMSWNSTSGIWDYNRNFSNPGLYTYNVTCSKGGYETKIQPGIVDIVLNNPPTVTLVSPPDNNVTTNRTPTFVWDGTDIEDDAEIQAYQLNITCLPTCSGDNRLITITSGSPYIDENHTLQNSLNYLMDDGYYYIWKVRANDSYGWGSWSAERKLNISGLIDIALTQDVVNFGSMLPDENNDTSDDNPPPFVLENLGNTLVNVTINASELWNTQHNPSNYFLYKIDNVSGEQGSFDWGSSKVTWTQVPNATSLQTAIVGLNWSSATDSAEIDLNVTVPGIVEGAGQRSSLITFTASYNEEKSGN